MARTRGSSAFSTTAPSAGMARTSALFSRCTSSREPRNSVCADDTVVTAATVGRAISASAAISPGRLVPSSSAAARCSAVSLRRVSGRPHWLLKLDSGLSTGPSAAEHRRHHLLGRGLAVRARHRRDRNREALAVPCAQPPEGLRRLVHQHDGHARRQVVGHRVDHEAGGAAPDGVAEEGVAVEALAADGEEGLTDAEAPAVDGDAGHGDAEVASEEGAAGAADDVFDGECRHARSYVALPARAARAWARSSKGSTSEPTIW